MILSKKDFDVFLGAHVLCSSTDSGTTKAVERAMSGRILMSFILAICEEIRYLAEREERDEGCLISYNLYTCRIMANYYLLVHRRQRFRGSSGMTTEDTRLAAKSIQMVRSTLSFQEKYHFVSYKISDSSS